MLHSNKCIDCKSYLDDMSFKDDQLIFRCFDCRKNYKKDFNKKVIKKFANLYKFCDGDINKFILLLRKSVYPYEYMDNIDRFDEALLPKKIGSRLNMENITTSMQKKYLKTLIIKI